MARRKITQDFWDALLIAFRDQPGNYSAAARMVGCTERTAKKAYLQGWPELPFATKPIKDLIMEERAVARARIELEEEREQIEMQREAVAQQSKSEAARLQAIKAREEEGKLVQGARAAAIIGLNNSLRLAAPMQKLMDRLGKEVETLTEKSDSMTMKERIEAINVLRRYSMVIKDLTFAGQTAMEMERLFLGEPTSIVQLTSDFDSMPFEELVEAAGYADEVLKRAEKRGLVVLEKHGKEAN